MKKINGLVYLSLAILTSCLTIFCCYVLGCGFKIVDRFEVPFILVSAMIGVLTLFLLYLNYILYDEAIIRFTCKTVEETITITSVEKSSVSHLIYTQVYGLMIPRSILSDYTEIRCSEYPQTTFSRMGHYNYCVGERLNITLYVRKRKVVGYDF